MITLKLDKSDDDLKYIKAYGEGCIAKNTYIIGDTETSERLGIIEYVKTSDEIYIYYLYISENHRNKEIGTKVVNHVKGDCVLFGDSLNNPQALGFWSSLNAEFDEDIDEDYRDYNIPFTIY